MSILTQSLNQTTDLFLHTTFETQGFHFGSDLHCVYVGYSTL
jgi:hypothetical protein